MQCTRLIYLLLNDDVRPLETVEYATKGQRKLAEDARELILRDPSLHLTAEDIADQLSCTAPTLKKYFRKVYGIPMYSFLQDVRMKTAEEALSGTKKSIAQIAEASGYSNTSKFCALFKKTYGVSPMEYRRLHS
jgi:AraC-like DNA-binding protein